MRFKTIPVVFIRITGTFNTANEIFHLVHFECPSKPGTIFKPDQEGVADDFPVIYGIQKLSLANNSTNEDEDHELEQNQEVENEESDQN